MLVLPLRMTVGPPAGVASTRGVPAGAAPAGAAFAGVASAGAPPASSAAPAWQTASLAPGGAASTEWTTPVGAQLVLPSKHLRKLPEAPLPRPFMTDHEIPFRREPPRLCQLPIPLYRATAASASCGDRALEARSILRLASATHAPAGGQS